MITIYDLLEVSEKASKEEIEQSYLNLIEEYKIDSNLTQEENNDNKIILEKLKLAYDILTNDEKRKRYDADLAKKRAEELIKNVQVMQVQENKEQTENLPKENENIQKNIKQEKQNSKVDKREIIYEEEEIDTDSEIELADTEKKKIKKAARKEFQKNLKKAQKAEEEYQKAYNEAYNDYLRKMGFTVEEPWTFSRIIRFIVGLIVIIGIGIFIWMLPPTRALLIQLYEENFIIKSLVDIIINIFK